MFILCLYDIVLYKLYKLNKVCLFKKKIIIINSVNEYIDNDPELS